MSGQASSSSSDSDPTHLQKPYGVIHASYPSAALTHPVIVWPPHPTVVILLDDALMNGKASEWKEVFVSMAKPPQTNPKNLQAPIRPYFLINPTHLKALGLRLLGFSPNDRRNKKHIGELYRHMVEENEGRFRFQQVSPPFAPKCIPERDVVIDVPTQDWDEIQAPAENERNNAMEALLLYSIANCPPHVSFLVIALTPRSSVYQGLPDLQALGGRQEIVSINGADQQSMKSGKVAIKNFLRRNCLARGLAHPQPRIRPADIFAADTNVYLNLNDVETPSRWMTEAAACSLTPFLAPQCHSEIGDPATQAEAIANVTTRNGFFYRDDWCTRNFRTIPPNGVVLPDSDVVVRAQCIEYAQVVPGRGLAFLTRDRTMSVWCVLLIWTRPPGQPEIRMRSVFYVGEPAVQEIRDIMVNMVSTTSTSILLIPY